ncbi:MAG: FlgD ig protein, partial [Actinomycetota bacterium]|nr:FlgD ig protein [Actinomycetota bacterium]
MIEYWAISGGEVGKSRMRRLAGSELTNLPPLTYPVDSLKQTRRYRLTVLARDLAGNYTLSGPDTFYYDTSYVVPLIKRFTIKAKKAVASAGTDTVGLMPIHHLLAGSTVTLTLTADASLDGKRDAVTYKGNSTLKVTDKNNMPLVGRLVQLTGDGVTDQGNGRASLDAKTWLAGKRTVTLRDSTAIDTFKVAIVDSSDATKPYTGTLDSLIVFDPEAYSQIVVSAPDTVTQGQAFMVDVKIADKYGNQRTKDSRYVSITANKVGVEVPTSAVHIADGKGSFAAKAAGWSGSGLTFRVFDLIDANLGNVTSTAEGPNTYVTENVRDGVSKAVAVMAADGEVPVGTALDAPDTLVAEDYMGADGLGDQGGFVLLTWALSDDHDTATGYRIYREMQVNYRAGGAGEDALVALDEPALDWVVWGKVDAVPGETIGRAVVATLDNVATHWAIAAERGRQTTAKEAFDGVEAVATPYELMASTLAESKKAAAKVDGPVFATLTPEALAFVETGVVPQMKSVDADLSPKTQTVDLVRAIDNIPPKPVAYLQAKDTPNDAGSSITVLWTKSESDLMLPRSVSNAIGNGPVADQVAGVLGYNVYRKVGEGQSLLVGKVGTGETSFQDVTALNGVRYTYQVRPFDADNETPALFERTALSIRNNAVDASGQPVYGLFGMDNKVGFDDFFVFADNFGMSAASESFEPAFDLVANAKVDFEDFFAFADNFGREARAIAGKVVPTMAGLNTDARLYLATGAELPRVGEEVAIAVSLADFVQLKGYGFSVNYDAAQLEFVKVVAENNLLGEGELAQPTILSQKEGDVAIAAYGETVSEGDLNVSLVFRTKTEIENTFVEVMESDVRDGSYAVNPVALPAPVQIQTRPEQYALGNNYPNPFNPATTIKYALPEAGFVKLEVYNVVGQAVRTLVAGQQNAGRYVVQWDASDDSGRSLSSGIYFYRLQAGGEFLEVKKMLLLK